MNKTFWITLVALVVAYFYIPQINSIITLVGVLIFIFHLSAIISNLIIHSPYLPTKRFVLPLNRLVLITGCDTGFGFELAKRLDRYGFFVLAGVLSTDSDGCKLLKTNSSKRLKTIKLDITNQTDIDRVTDLIAYLTNHPGSTNRQPVFGNEDGDLKLWAIVNNAGL